MKYASLPGHQGNLLFLLFLILVFYFPQNTRAQFVKGADIGWLQQMEATGYKFYNSSGVQQDCMQILKDKGINSVRFRVFVNPSTNKTDGHCSKKEVAQMALRAKNMGMRVMIDFHYSDSWADPGKQTKPAAWTSHTFNQLLNDVYNHTFEVLDTLKAIGATPEWVQIGNEIAGGMLWPDGKTWFSDGSPPNWSQLSQLLNKGYDATKAVDNSIKVIIHLESGSDNGKFRWFFDNAKNNNVKYDIIGASYYPYWDKVDYTANIDALGTNLNDMVSRYGKDVMVVETGGLFDQVQNTYDMLAAVIRKVNAVPNHKGLGVMYWEPEGEKSWSGYSLSCWSSNGRPTTALDAFLTDPSLGTNAVYSKPLVPVYPNPNSDGILNIDFKGFNGNTVVKVIGMDGKIVIEQSFIDQSKVLIDVSFLHGIYVLNITNKNQQSNQKIVIE